MSTYFSFPIPCNGDNTRARVSQSITRVGCVFQGMVRPLWATYPSVKIPFSLPSRHVSSIILPFVNVSFFCWKPFLAMCIQRAQALKLHSVSIAWSAISRTMEELVICSDFLKRSKGHSLHLTDLEVAELFLACSRTPVCWFEVIFVRPNFFTLGIVITRTIVSA